MIRLKNIISSPNLTRNVKNLKRFCSGAPQQIDDLNEESEKVIDQRFLPWRLLRDEEKISITGKEIETKIMYSSVLDGMVHHLPKIKRAEEARKRYYLKEKERRDQLLSKNESSILVEKLAGVTENAVNEESEKTESQVSFPLAKFAEIIAPASCLPKTEAGFDNRDISGMNYGTADPDVPASKVPCGGCGALLHCQITSLPGFLPKEIFTSRTSKQLYKELCQRCRFLQEHNVALNVQVSPEDYPKVLEVIKDQVAMAILIVDLLDFPGSIWPGILDIIGKKRPVCVVGNKVDLLLQDSRGYLDRVKKSLIDALEKTGISQANIKHVALVSAKTGYGIEELITKLQGSWGFKGDVYLVGCTNVGKSSLFNALIQSDFCKSQAVDIIQRATVSPWPGTTLNLLKFPMLRPTGMRLYERTQRLKAEAKIKIAEQKLREVQLKETKDPKYAVLLGHIGRTFEVKKDPVEEVGSDPFSLNVGTVPKDSQLIFNPEHEMYTGSKWCYDTPGTVNKDQILTLLTLEELTTTLTTKLVRPRTLVMRPGLSFFLAGLARIDYPEGPHTLMLTVFSDRRLPITQIETQFADEFYWEALGTELLRVPQGGEERLRQWPGLSGKTLTIKGKGWAESAADVVLSSAGWVAVTGAEDTSYELHVMTPEARGIFLRDPPLLPFAVNLRGRRIPGTPAFQSDKLFIK